MTTKSDSKSSDVGADQVQAKVDKAEDKGYFGHAPDPTPNENYTVAGVTKGAPTPETDPEIAPARNVQADTRTAPTAKKKG